MKSTTIIVAQDEQLRSLIKDVVRECLNESTHNHNSSSSLLSKQEFVTLPEACKMLQLSRTSLYHLRRSGSMPFSRIGRKVYISLQDIQTLLLQKRAPMP